MHPLPARSRADLSLLDAPDGGHRAAGLLPGALHHSLSLPVYDDIVCVRVSVTMMDKVLQRLQALQAELAAIDPAHDLDVADKVASIASTFRDALASVDHVIGRPAAGSPNLRLSDYRRAG